MYEFLYFYINVLENTTDESETTEVVEYNLRLGLM